MVGFLLVEYFVEDVRLIPEIKNHVLVQTSIFQDVKNVRNSIYAAKIRE